LIDARIASITSDLATAVGLLAGVIAIGGLLSHARPVLTGASEWQVGVQPCAAVWSALASVYL
jgi:hypothetical protein